jgi:hypothetical protein
LDEARREARVLLVELGAGLGDNELEARDRLRSLVERRLPHRLRFVAEGVDDALHGLLGLAECPGDTDLSGEKVGAQRVDVAVLRAAPCVESDDERGLAHVHVEHWVGLRCLLLPTQALGTDPAACAGGVPLLEGLRHYARAACRGSAGGARSVHGCWPKRGGKTQRATEGSLPTAPLPCVNECARNVYFA